MDLKLSINADELARQLAVDVKDLNDKLEVAIQSLALQAHAWALEMSQNALHSTRSTYADNLKFVELSKNIYEVQLLEPAMWIEEGMSPHSLVPDLLRRNAKVAKDGSFYKAIPMERGKPATETPQASQNLEATLRAELKKRKIPLTKIEVDQQGKAILGKVHGFDIESKEKGPTGIPYLHGVRVYQQHEIDKKTHKPTGKLVKQFFTFRTVSSKHAAQGRWFHPGLDARNFLDRAFEKAMAQWENEILPSLTKR